MSMFDEFVKNIHTYDPSKLEEQLKAAKDGTVFMLDEETFVQVRKIKKTVQHEGNE